MPLSIRESWRASWKRRHLSRGVGVEKEWPEKKLKEEGKAAGSSKSIGEEGCQSVVSLEQRKKGTGRAQEALGGHRRTSLTIFKLKV